jgi:2-oxoglutarate ferredoxin oxidoreductase subunit alpha
MAKKFMKGCEAVAEAAVLGGCRFFAGYPITPQNEIPEYMSSRLPEVCGVFIQGESEVASINMVYGAASTGIRAMTSSSSPGISLKTEGISYLSGAKLPALIVNVSRGGPGLGSIQPAQSDYLQATKALGHGGFRVMVFAPNTLQEAVDLTYEAFEYAERDRNPVLLLMDGCLGSIMEMVELPPMRELSDKNTQSWKVGYNGQKRSARMITSIYPEAGLEANNKSRAELFKSWEENDVKVEEYLLDDAEYVVVAYGIAARVAKQAIMQLRGQGHKIGLIRPITLLPFPKQSFQKLNYDKVKAFIDIEMTIPAQMHDDISLEVRGRAPIYTYGRSGGILLDDDGVTDAIKKIIGGNA